MAHSKQEWEALDTIHTIDRSLTLLAPVPLSLSRSLFPPSLFHLQEVQSCSSDGSLPAILFHAARTDGTTVANATVIATAPSTAIAMGSSGSTAHEHGLQRRARGWGRRGREGERGVG